MTTRSRARKKKRRKEVFELPTDRRTPVDDMWRYAYLITGEKKIGKTTFAIEGCDEFVLQFDKPQLAYRIRETMIEDWKKFESVLKALEVAADSGDFPYNRIVVDGCNEWYQQCQTEVCRIFGIGHPSEEGYAKGWHKLRDMFFDGMNRLLRLQNTAKCGLIFLAHSEIKEVKDRYGQNTEKMVPILSPKCEEIINGKVDGWFAYDYIGSERIMIIRGNAFTGAGHRIDGHFLTPEKQPVKEIYMGKSAEEALNNFKKAFNNEQEYQTYKEYKASRSSKPKTKRRRRRG